MFFNFRPATYLLESTKVAHIAVAGAISRRRGPQLIKICVWDNLTEVWNEQETADDGFSAVSPVSGNAENEINRIAKANPLDAERILALSAGKICKEEEWHKVNLIDSCETDASEIIYRLTFCQDISEKAIEFRTARLKRLSRLWTIIQNDSNLPPSIKDLKDNVCFEWSPCSPHQNAVSDKGQRATLVYMGEDSELARIETIQKRLAAFLHRASSDPDQSLSAQQRLVVWFRDNDDQFVPFEPHRYVKIDQTGTSSEFDIAREI